MKGELVKRVIVSWEDIRAAVEGLPQAEQEIASEIVASAEGAVTADVEPADGPWYIRSAAVRGHAGIGEQPVVLPLAAAPGLTIVTARNGTGKSSLVDGVRHVLSNGQARRSDLVGANVHFPERAITVEVSNGPRIVKITCDKSGISWADADGYDGRVPTSWVADFARYLPVLLHSELSPFINKPSDLHDFLKQAIDLSALDDLLAEVDKIKIDGGKALGDLKGPWRAACDALTTAGVEAMAKEASVVGCYPTSAQCADLRSQAGSLPNVAPKRSITIEPWTVDHTSVKAAVVDVSALELARANAVSGVRDVRVAIEALLQATGNHIDDLRDNDRCPVCQTSGRGWVQRAENESQRLGQLLSEVTAAEAPVKEALSRVAAMLPPPMPTGLDETLRRFGGDAAESQIAEWQALSAASGRLTVATVTTAEIHDLTRRSAALLPWCAGVFATAEAEHAAGVAERAKVGETVVRWLDAVEQSRTKIDRGVAAGSLADKVDGWIKHARDAVFEPIKEEVKRIWSALNVDGPLAVTDVTLTGGTRRARKVSIGLEIEGTSVVQGTDNAAILSTGQRNALSLAAYLPRATQSASPFGFLVLDDPIHAFDSDRVRFLAEELVRLAEQYQIIVLTHDDRLWRALKALGARPTHVQLRRAVGKQSEVTVTIDQRPGDVLLDELEHDLNGEAGIRPLGTDDARVAMTLAMCRQALDTEVLTQVDILGRRLGKSDGEISEDLDAAHTTVDQLNVLNQYAAATQVAPLDYQPFKATLDAFNAGAHGETAPRQRSAGQTALTDCLQWLADSRQLVRLVSAMGD